jgi:hypothetical protein
MKQLIDGAFEVLATLFNKIPILNKLQGYRAVLGYLGLAVTTLLSANGLISVEAAGALAVGFNTFKDLALNAKGR